jgi:hypothetical protein
MLQLTISTNYETNLAIPMYFSIYNLTCNWKNPIATNLQLKKISITTQLQLNGMNHNTHMMI